MERTKLSRCWLIQCERTGIFLVFSQEGFSFSSMPFFSLFIALNTENTYSRYQIECERLNVSLNRSLCPVLDLECCKIGFRRLDESVTCRGPR